MTMVARKELNLHLPQCNIAGLGGHELCTRPGVLYPVELRAPNYSPPFLEATYSSPILAIRPRFTARPNAVYR